MTIEQKIMALRDYPAKELDREVRRALETKTDDPISLAAKAALVTGLREAKLWPAVYRRKR